MKTDLRLLVQVPRAYTHDVCLDTKTYFHLQLCDVFDRTVVHCLPQRQELVASFCRLQSQRCLHDTGHTKLLVLLLEMGSGAFEGAGSRGA